MSRRPVAVALALMGALVLAGCAAGEPSSTTTPTASPSPTTSDDPDPEPSPSPDATSPSPSPSELAGEPYDGPPTGGAPATMLVIGIAADDVLNVRAGPGIDEAVIGTLPPLAADVAATGAARLLPGSIWVEVETDDEPGWVNASFLAFPGRTDDVTSQVLEAAGTRPSATTLAGLAMAVAELRASVDPPSQLVISDGPSVGDLGEVTIDVVGLGDDAQIGERLVVFATVDDGTFTLRTVEATQLCGRGTGLDAGCP